MLTIKPNGCPDHPYFKHDNIDEVAAESCWSAPCSSSCCSSSSCSSSCCSSPSCGSSYCASCSASASTSPHTPRFHNFTLRVPSSPVVAASPYVPDSTHPIGVAINGVLIIPTHYNTTSHALPTTLDFDSCNGHSDKSGVYHYHSIPTCILSSLSLPTNFPSTSSPSPVLGIALDGFPIIGPYDHTGR